MKTLRIHGKSDMREEHTAVPEPGPGQVRLRMAYAGICGSDLHYYFHGANGEFVVREPLTPGHEVSGTVDLDPSGVLAPGTPVTIHPATFGTPEPGIEDRRHLWPGGSYLGSASTWPHTQGGMAEYLLVERSMLRVLPEGMSLKSAALAEPLAVALHAIHLAGGVAGKRVLVSGSGPIGLLVTAAAAAQGAAAVTATDVLAGPLERARHVGATSTILVGEQQVPALAYDVAFECSSAPAAVSAAVAAVRRAGTVVQVGVLPNEPRSVNLAPLVSKEVTMIGSFRFDDEIGEAIELLATDPLISEVVTHAFPASHVAEAFDTALDSQVSGKVVVSLWLDEADAGQD
ncbi:MAG: zinc-binding dehydrogenase [Dermatophilaceae bacterium]